MTQYGPFSVVLGQGDLDLLTKVYTRYGELAATRPPAEHPQDEAILDGLRELFDHLMAANIPTVETVYHDSQDKLPSVVFSGRPNTPHKT